jgi:hypothetical protein
MAQSLVSPSSKSTVRSVPDAAGAVGTDAVGDRVLADLSPKATARRPLLSKDHVSLPVTDAHWCLVDLDQNRLERSVLPAIVSSGPWTLRQDVLPRNVWVPCSNE